MTTKLFGAAVTGSDALDGVIAVPKTKDSAGIQDAINKLMRNNDSVSAVITNGTWNLGIIDFTVEAGHSLTERTPVFVEGCPNSNYDGYYYPLNVGTTSFQGLKETDPGAYGSGNGYAYNEGGGLVFLPPGGYAIDKKVTLYSNITLMGAGSGSTILYAGGLNDDAVAVDPAPWDASSSLGQVRHNINVQDFVIVRDVDDINHRGVCMDGVIEGNITNVMALYFQTGISFRGWGGTILNSKVADCYTGYDLSWPDPDHTSGATNGVALISSRYEASPIHPPYELSFSSASYDGTRVMVVTPTDHKLQYGAEATLYGCDNTTFNGVYNEIIFDSSTQFTAIPLDGTPSGTASDGTVKGRLIGVMVNGIMNSSHACVIENVHPVVYLTSGTRVDGTTTFITSRPHYITTADPVTVMGCDPSSFNENYTYATKLDATTFTVLNDGSDATTSTGFINSTNKTTCFYIRRLDMPDGSLTSPTLITGLYTEGMEKIAVIDGAKGVTFLGGIAPLLNEGLDPFTLRNGSDNTDSALTIIGQSNCFDKIVNSFNSSLGIGTLRSTPLQKLDVRGNISVSGAQWTTNGDTAHLYLGVGPSHYINAVYGDGIHIGSYQVPDAVTVKEITGYLGIDQTSPQQMLDVNGGIRIGDTTVALAGTLRFNDGTMQVYQGGGWKTIAAT